MPVIASITNSKLRKQNEKERLKKNKNIELSGEMYLHSRSRGVPDSEVVRRERDVDVAGADTLSYGAPVRLAHADLNAIVLYSKLRKKDVAHFVMHNNSNKFHF